MRFASADSRLNYAKITEPVKKLRDQPKVADAATELLQDIVGRDTNPCRLVFGVASLPLGAPVELEVRLEVAA